MRKIALITSTRAEYGIMSRLIDMLNNDNDIDFKLLVTGMHLSKKFGSTYKEISVPIYKKINIDIEKEPSHAMSLAIEKFSNEFKKIKPDMLIILGDRYEICGAAIASMLNKIPIAHIHGGESTEGAIDEAIRHSITKMSHLHFTSCEEYRKRVIQLGENPERVFNVGSLGVENIKKLPLMNKKEFEESIDFKLGDKNVLVTFHPVTLEGNVKMQFGELLKALDELENTKIIITCPNSDEGHQEIFTLIEQFQSSHKNVKVFKSLGVKRYLSALKHVDMVIGNSSSGIIEVPSFKIPTINIGNRQKGRIQANSIINCEPQKTDILNAIKKGYELDCSNTINPYENENTAENIVKIIKTTDCEKLLNKKFYDLTFSI